MARQVIPLGAPVTVTADGIDWQNQAANIDASLVEGGAAATLARLTIQPQTGNRLYTSGPNLTNRWEYFAAAISVRVGPYRITLGGVRSVLSASRENIEPYDWAWIASERPRIQDWINGVRTLSAERRADSELTLRDRVDIPFILESAMGLNRIPKPNLSGIYSDYREVTQSDTVDNCGEDCVGLYLEGAGNISCLFRGQQTNVLTGFVVTEGGRGYTAAPTVAISGGGGTGGTATAVLGAPVISVTVTAGGTGYTVPPAVSFSGGNGSGAEAEAVITSGVVTAINVTNGGRGYTTAPTVTVGGAATGTARIGASVDSVTILTTGAGYTGAPTVTFTGGGGVNQATATATVAGGELTGITITDAGSGYESAPTITLTGGGATTQGTAEATITDVIHVGSLTLGNAGSGYVDDPIIQFTGGGGSGAAARATRAASPRTIAVVANQFVPGLFQRVRSTDTTVTDTIQALQG